MFLLPVGFLLVSFHSIFKYLRAPGFDKSYLLTQQPTSKYTYKMAAPGKIKMEEENLLSPAPRPSRRRRAPELFVPSAEKAAIKAEIKAAVKAEIVELEKQSKKSRKRPAAAAGQKTKKKASSSSSSSSKGDPYPDDAQPQPHH